MRQIESVELDFRHQWLVQFDDGSRISVDVSTAVFSPEKSDERVRSAAMNFSESHPEGQISSVVVNLEGLKIN